jgi:predicted RNase H-like HicB family nuclease
MHNVKIIVEKHADGYVAYPLGLKGVVVGQGESYEEALSDVKSAIKFHVESFGNEVSEAGDLDGDGHADVVVGAPTADHAGEDSGRVYAFSGRDGQ